MINIIYYKDDLLLRCFAQRNNNIEMITKAAVVTTLPIDSITFIGPSEKNDDES